ncbi:MAG: hypothetical protein M1820_006209 [Bogoriella megaspora]|nr:MAG: hypothetical protein M1820_006209 [Bogoriella megaspora]
MSLGPAGASLDPDQAENNPDIEAQFSVKGTTTHEYLSQTFFKGSPSLPVVEHIEAYWGLLNKCRASELRLTKYDDDIYAHFKREFPEYDLKSTLNEDEVKSKAGKERWRNFIETYKETVKDYNFGTIVRTNPSFEYGEKETILVVRMQFYAFEIARNREGLNDWIYERNHPEQAKAA